MKVIQPIALTTPAVTTSVPESDYGEWDATKAYAQGDKVIKAATHRIYQAAQANKGQDPALTLGTYWTDQAPTNAWAMFDQATGTYTMAQGSISVGLTPGSVGALAVLDTDAETVRVQILVNGVVIFDQTQATNKSGGVIDNYYDYFFAPIGKVSTLTFLPLPSVANATIKVTFTAAAPNLPIRVGTLLVGQSTELGLLEAEPTVSIIDFSTKTTDPFGATTVVQRAFSKQMEVKSLIDSSAVDGVQSTIASLRATPALWIAADGFDALAVYGFFKDFSISIPTLAGSYVSLTVEGLA